MNQAMLFDGDSGSWEACHPDGACAVSRQLANRTGRECPLVDRDGIVVAFSGFLTNQADLNRRLGRSGPVTGSLPATVLHAWLEWGTDAPARLYGCFAFLVWDRRRREVFLAVDHLAQRTLYYHHTPDRLTAASLPHAVAGSPAVSAGINERQLARFILPCFLRADESFFREVMPVEPGTGVLIGSRSVRRIRYWKPEEIPQIPASTDSHQQFQELVRNNVQSAVSSRTSGRVGAFLSGGLDSSLVAMLACEAVQTYGESPKDLISVTSKPAVNTGQRNDWYYSSLVNNQLGSSLHSVNGLDSSIDVLERLFAATGMPPESMDYPVEAAMFETLSNAGATLALCGEGGEASASSWARGLLPELFTRGRFCQLVSEWYAEWKSGVTPGSLMWDTFYPLVPDRFLSIAGIRRCDRSFEELAASHFLNPEFLRPLWKSGLADEVETAITSPRRWFPRSGRCVRTNDLENIRLVPASRTLAATGFGLELACPLLDRTLIEWVLAMPPSLRRHKGQSRRLIRDAFRSQLPDPVLNRTSKSPRFPDYAEWLSLHRDEICRRLSVPSDSISTIPFRVTRPDTSNPLVLHRLHTMSVAMQFLAWSRELRLQSPQDAPQAVAVRNSVAESDQDVADTKEMPPCDVSPGIRGEV